MTFRSQMSAAVVLSLLASTAFADGARKGGIDARKEFEKHCEACHMEGGNTARPEKTLKKKDLQANGIKTARDIVRLMRNPGPGMPAFDRATIDDKEAQAIAEYILKTFK